MRKIKRRVEYDLPIRFLAGQNIFNPRLLEKRKQISERLKNYIDRILYNGRFIAMIDSHNRFKYENVEYTKEELAECRLLTKGLNGIVFPDEITDQHGIEPHPSGMVMGPEKTIAVRNIFHPLDLKSKITLGKEIERPRHQIGPRQGLLIFGVLA